MDSSFSQPLCIIPSRFSNLSLRVTMITLVATGNMYFTKIVMMHNAVRKSEQFIVYIR